MEEIITCINCPVGCRMTVVLSETKEFVSVSGNSCPRGAAYARQECTLPERMITAVIPLANRSLPLSVKTSSPVPKNMISQIMTEIGNLRLSAPVRLGDVIIPDILHTGSDIIATRNVL